MVHRPEWYLKQKHLHMYPNPPGIKKDVKSSLFIPTGGPLSLGFLVASVALNLVTPHFLVCSMKKVNLKEGRSLEAQCRSIMITECNSASSSGLWKGGRIRSWWHLTPLSTPLNCFLNEKVLCNVWGPGGCAMEVRSSQTIVRSPTTVYKRIAPCVSRSLF